MGVDCRITLPPAARLRDVADVIGALAGLPMKYESFGNGHSGGSAHCEGIRTESVSIPECARIAFHSPVDGEGHHVLYHFESSRPNAGCRGMLPNSSPFWCALARGLVDFFGGSVDYKDCDDVDVDYSQPWREDISAEDAEEWEAFQQRKMAVRALTQEDLKAAAVHAAYR